MKISNSLYAYFVLTLLASSVCLMLSACHSGNKTPGTDSTEVKTDKIHMDSPGTGMIKPKGQKPDRAPDIHPEMQAMIEKLVSYGAPAVETLTAIEARKNPTRAMAVMDLMKENNIPMPVPKVDTIGKNIPVAGGSIHVRIYTPQTAMTSYPMILFIQGSGWVIADMNTYDASASGICELTGAVVVSVNYRQGPENKFPTAHQDCFAAYLWMLKNAASFKGDTSKVGLLGESAGGNLAANVFIMARDKKIKVPVAEVLVYPITQSDMNTASYQKKAMAKPLSKAMMAWFFKMYLPSMASATDPGIDLIRANLKGLSPTTIIADELDPLQTDGRMLRDKMKEQGVAVTYYNYDGVTHAFLGTAAIVPEAKQAQALTANRLKNAFGE
ncbi:MAG: alpha/beta hydrolase [Bacteroidota bacterium]|nr:alpha/beta hydrolase [Bacteroidota bacterium]MDP4249696.1 alpha/beta hydrolase [Bacteroidota bacterium]